MPQRFYQTVPRGSLSGLSRAQPALRAAGEVEGDRERDHEYRQHPEFEQEAVEFGGTQSLLDGGGHGQDAPHDRYQPDQQERPGHYLSLAHYRADGCQKLREDKDQEHLVQDLQRSVQRPGLRNHKETCHCREEDHPDCHEQKDRRGVVYDLLGEIYEACQPGDPAGILLRPGTNVPCLCPARQCRKWRRLVITIATPRSSAARTTSSSRLEPPGCITAFTPASASDSSPSANGKKASLAATAPIALSPAFLTARCAASTRLVWPAPMPTVASSFASTMALLLTLLTTFQAKRRSESSAAVGSLLVTSSYPESSSTRSDSWSRSPPVTCLAESSGRARAPAFKRIMFGFAEKTSRASASKAGAIRTSVKTLEISAASSPSTGSLSATMPPKAEIGSEAKAFLYAPARSAATAVAQRELALVPPRQDLREAFVLRWGSVSSLPLRPLGEPPGYGGVVPGGTAKSFECEGPPRLQGDLPELEL